MATGHTDFVMLTDATFEKEVLMSPVPVLVIFGAESSGGAASALRQIWDGVREYDGKIKIGSMDIAKNRRTAEIYEIRELPTLLFFKDGIVVAYQIGTIWRKGLRTCLQTLLEA